MKNELYYDQHGTAFVKLTEKDQTAVPSETTGMAKENNENRNKETEAPKPRKRYKEIPFDELIREIRY